MHWVICKILTPFGRRGSQSGRSRPERGDHRGQVGGGEGCRDAKVAASGPAPASQMPLHPVIPDAWLDQPERN